jgi:hypothetical protein
MRHVWIVAQAGKANPGTTRDNYHIVVGSL